MKKVIVYSTIIFLVIVLIFSRIFKMRIIHNDFGKISISIMDSTGNKISDVPLIHFINTSYTDNFLGIPIYEPGYYPNLKIEKVFSRNDKEVIFNTDINFRIYEKYNSEIILINIIPKDKSDDLCSFINRFYVKNYKIANDSYESKVLIINDVNKSLTTWYSQNGRIPVQNVKRYLYKDVYYNIKLNKIK